MRKLLIDAVRGWRRLVFRLKWRKFSAGRNFIVGPRARVAHGATFTAGDRVNIAAEFVSHDHLVLGDDIMISARVSFIGNDHHFDEPGLSIQDQQTFPRSTVVLEGDNLIGYGSIILGNVRIGRGTIVGAGSLVTGDLPPQTVCVGRPARPIRNRGERGHS